MSHRDTDSHEALWEAAKQLNPDDSPTITTDQKRRTLYVTESTCSIQQNPFPYDGLLTVLKDKASDDDKEYSLLIPKNETLAPRLVSPDNAHGERICRIDTTPTAPLSGNTADELGIPTR